MTREQYEELETRFVDSCLKNSKLPTFADAIIWAERHPSDELIMRILNCIGYEERSWVDTVRKELEKRN